MINKQSTLGHAWKIELLAIVFTIVLMLLIMLPIIKNVPDFPFLVYNICTILVFFTLIRYLFLLRYTPFARFAPLKAVLIFLAIPLLVFLIDGLAEFQFQLDEEGAFSMVSHLNNNKQLPLSKYIRAEMVFFATGAIIASILLPIRMIVSLWRVINRNTV